MHPDGSHVLSAAIKGAAVLLSFRLGLAEGITVLCRRAHETEFLTLAEDDDSPILDARPKLQSSQPELRIYQAVLHYDDGETRRLSNEVRIEIP